MIPLPDSKFNVEAEPTGLPPTCTVMFCAQAAAMDKPSNRAANFMKTSSPSRHCNG
jgi:hypothetical protein